MGHGDLLGDGRRWFAPDDAEALMELFDEVRSGHFQPHPMTLDHARKIVGYRGKDVYRVLEANGRLVAYGLLRGWDEGFDVPSLGVAVSHLARGRGLGRVTVELLHEEAARRGAKSVRLRVDPANARARQLYESLGYKPARIERGELVMVCRL